MEGYSKVVKWEYRISWVDDDWTMVDKNMAEWASKGWELVSGSVTTYLDSEPYGPRITTGHFRYVQYWRKEVLE
jgi:hypothetical protein